MGRIHLGTSGWVYKDWRGLFYEGWRTGTPANFLFACKGSRYLTHMKRLKDSGQGLDRYFERVNALGPKLGPVLWQLPPQMDKPDLERLATFLAALPRHTRHVVEFRDAAWYADSVLQVLDHFGVALCEHDLVDVPAPRPTGGFRYVRFHGAAGKYFGRYGKRGLRPFAEELAEWRHRGRGDAFVYFNNDRQGHALRDAFALRELLGETTEATVRA